MSGTRLAGRLAWREVRRRPGRTFLVTMLVFVPVFAMTIGDVIGRSDGDTWDTWVAGTDIATYQSVTDPVEVANAIPADATTTTVTTGSSIPIERDDGQIVEGLDIELIEAESGPATAVTTRTGRLPEADGEIWLSSEALRRIGGSVGDTLVLRHPAGEWRVVGSGAPDHDYDRQLVLFVGLSPDEFDDGRLQEVTIIGLADDSAESVLATVDRLGAMGEVSISSRVWDGTGQPPKVFAWGWVAGVLGLVAVGVIIAAAFATSARRQLATIGILAANGSPERLIRRSLALQGFWSGLFGSVFAVAAAVVVLLASRGIADDVTGRRLPSYRFLPADLAVIVLTGTLAATLAALIPARSASKVPVMAALAGRRPLASVPSRLVPIGLGCFGVGVMMLAVAAGGGGGDAAAAGAVIGGVLVLAGVCCCSPLAIDTMSSLAARIGGSWRFAGRSLGRTRTRSAAVVTAIAVAAAAAAAGSVAAIDGTDDRGVEFSSSIGENVAMILPVRLQPVVLDEADPNGTSYISDEPLGPWTPMPLSTDEANAAEDSVAGSRWTTRQIVQVGAEPIEPAAGGAVAAIDSGIVVANDVVAEIYGLSEAERSVLGDVGAIALGPIWLDGGDSGPSEAASPIELAVPTPAGEVVELPLALRDLPTTETSSWTSDGYHSSDLELGPTWVSDEFLITPEAAERAGLRVIDNGGWLVTDHDLTASERAALRSAVVGDDALLSAYRDVSPPDLGDPVPIVSFPYHPDGGFALAALQAIILAAALVMVMLVVAIGLSLAAAESKEERDVLIAVGARPRTLRSMAGSKAVVMTATGCALGIPASLIPVAAIYATNDDADTLQIPWITVAALLVVIPLLAGFAATTASAIAQRFRPVQMSTIATD